MPAAALLGLGGVLGAVLGSFLNVCVYRWPRDESVVAPRSRCPECDAPIAWYDNVPVLSWLALRGRCRKCGARISIQYPMVELATSLIWIAAVARYGATPEAVRTAVFLTILLGIALTDARHYIIPDEFSLGGLVVGLAFSLLPGGMRPLASFGGAALGFGLLWGIGMVGERIFRKPAMGFGDVKMMGMVGAFLGPAGVLLTLFLGAALGSVVFGPIAWKTRKLVPFGVFLALGAAVTHAWGQQLVDWYVRSVLH